MPIEVSYKINYITETGNSMSVEFSTEGKEAVILTVPLPYEGQSLEKYLSSYIPVSFWKENPKIEDPFPLWKPSQGESGKIYLNGINFNKTVEYYPEYESDKESAQKFFLGKEITDREPQYLLTQWNLTTNEMLGNLFSSGENAVSPGRFMVKVKNSVVSEWYESIVGPFTWVSKDLNTGKILDKYVLTQRGLEKYISDVGVDPTITHFGNFNSIPPTLKSLLGNFEYRYYIISWALKPYGFIVEFVYPKISNIEV
jgi:hypothetical protein